MLHIIFIKSLKWKFTFKPTNWKIGSILLFVSLAGIIGIQAQSQTLMASDTVDAKKASSIIADNATLQLISDQFSFTEGPAADKNGNVYFTDQPNNRIWKFSTDRKLSVFMENAGRSNGTYFDKDGNLITCADEHNQMWSITPEEKLQ